jgi:16S rRNA (cytosine967-C5)-methyltransferase
LGIAAHPSIPPLPARPLQARRRRAARVEGGVGAAGAIEKATDDKGTLMKTGARIEAAIALLDALGASGHGPGASARRAAPADAVANRFFRARRYIGAKDRAAVAGLVYGVLRHRAQLDWWLARAGAAESEGAPPPARARILAALALIEGRSEAAIGQAFDGSKFCPPALKPVEQRLVRTLAGHTLSHPDQPPAVRHNVPAWLWPALAERFGTEIERELAALAEPAPLDLRANALKTDQRAAQKALALAGIAAAPCRFAPFGLRARGRPNLGALDLFQSGGIEVHDVGSQLAAALVGAKPGMRVCDFCAGAGGKSLAIAAAMANKGVVVACDTSERRLAGATRRLRRAGVHNVERRRLASERDPWVKRHAQGFDRVLIDTPCSGTGTWRRNPDARWTLDPNDVAELTALQARVLDSAARLVKPGGRLVYVTCSLLPAENERQAEAFAARSPAFRTLPIAQVWAETVGGRAPAEGLYLKLAPGRHGTDGFFVAVFERAAGETLLE